MNSRKIALITTIILVSVSALLSSIGYFMADPTSPRGAIIKAALLQFLALIGLLVLLFVNVPISNLLLTLVSGLLVFTSVIMQLLVLGKIADYAAARNCVIVSASLTFVSLFIVVLPLLECTAAGEIVVPLPSMPFFPSAMLSPAPAPPQFGGGGWKQY